MHAHHPEPVAKRNAKETYNHSSESGVAATGRKFMLSLRESVYNELQKVADQRGLKIQGLIRAVIVPEWQIEHPIIHAEGLRLGVYNPERESTVKESTSISSWPRVRGAVDQATERKLVAESQSRS